MRRVSVLNRTALGRVVSLALGLLGLIVLVLFSDSNDWGNFRVGRGPQAKTDVQDAGRFKRRLDDGWVSYTLL